MTSVFLLFIFQLMVCALFFCAFRITKSFIESSTSLSEQEKEREVGIISLSEKVFYIVALFPFIAKIIALQYQTEFFLIDFTFNYSLEMAGFISSLIVAYKTILGKTKTQVIKGIAFACLCFLIFRVIRRCL